MQFVATSGNIEMCKRERTNVRIQPQDSPHLTRGLENVGLSFTKNAFAWSFLASEEKRRARLWAETVRVHG